MKFYEFAKMLYPICGAGETRYNFVIRLIESIIEDDAEDDCAVLSYSRDYAGRVYNGSKQIKPADVSYINGHIDKQKFEDFICGFSESAAESIVVALAMKGIVANKFNFHEVCTETFVQVLLDAVKGDATAETNTAATRVNTDLYDKYGFQLLIEASFYCPNDGCAEPLYFKKSGKAEPRYVPTVVDPEGSPANPNNLIALCPKCSDFYCQSPGLNEIQRMKAIKKEIARESSSREVAADVKIESGIRLVLERITDASDDLLKELTYTPQMVINKIIEGNKALRRKVLRNVSMYFEFTHGVFQELSIEGKLRFDKVAVQIRNCYIGENDNGRSQPEIFDALVRWLKDLTHEDQASCEAVISYFVQSCEVFDAIAK
ncbi:MAG: hypothetical protein EOM59_15970 [Clostridia bacterium]|nr:hypothetical protein [Clostridia bacterium]